MAGALAKHFEQVEVLERDRLTASAASRSGTPQDRHRMGCSNPLNTTLDARHGFQIAGGIQVGSSPSVFPILRQCALNVGIF
jgi:hypothetical protein